MALALPNLSEEEFRERLVGAIPHDLPADAVARMYQHYRELGRWNRRMALVGAGLAGRVVERLFAESLAALPLLGGAKTIVDIGSGAGFPGLVLAAAMPRARVVLVEPRQKKWAFLRAAADRAALSCLCLNARVSAALPSGIPETIDRITVRALRLTTDQFVSLSGRLGQGGSFLIWSSRALELPNGFEGSRAIELGPGRGRIQEVVVSRNGGVDV